jgi:hypothetical protein
MKKLALVSSFALAACATADNSQVGGSNANQSTQSSINQGTKVTMLPTDNELRPVDYTGLVRQTLDLTHVREARVQLIHDDSGQHLLVYLLAPTTHAVAFARIDLADNSVTQPYTLQDGDRLQQPGAKTTPKCPDETVQFIAFCPNDDQLELQVTNEVADHAEAAKLKTVRLLQKAATRAAYLNYMVCPNVLGNFYDGDANPDEITTVDGTLTNTDISSYLNFGKRVTNIWLACEAFNDPMLSAMTTTAQSKKYAAGKNDLEVGPSDKAAACAMEAAIDGKPMTAAFQQCYQTIDDSSDQWGFDGPGSDDFYK